MEWGKNQRLLQRFTYHYREGGKGADIRHIKPADNRGAGSYIGNKVEKLPDGAKVKIVVK
ncbi:competence protein [Bacillus sp. 17RED48]|nr:competence protein [Bacillus sp. 17RED48]